MRVDIRRGHLQAAELLDRLLAAAEVLLERRVRVLGGWKVCRFDGECDGKLAVLLLLRGGPGRREVGSHRLNRGEELDLLGARRPVA